MHYLMKLALTLATAVSSTAAHVATAGVTGCTPATYNCSYNSTWIVQVCDGQGSWQNAAYCDPGQDCKSGDDEARRTLWLGGNEASTPVLGPSGATKEAIVQTKEGSVTSLLAKGLSRKRRAASAGVGSATEEDPWAVYEAGARILRERPVFLAQHKTDKWKLVNIEQRPMERQSARSLIQTIDRYSHRSFLGLVDAFYHGDQCFLVWEPAQLALDMVSLSRCPITESQLAQIVWPILRGIQFLRNRGRALATLSLGSVLLTEAGHVRVTPAAGVDSTCEIAESEMNADTLKQTALAAIVNDLMKRNRTNTPWTAAAEKLPFELVDKSLDELLRVPFFAQMEGEGSLKMLVEIANKTAYHSVRILNRPETTRQILG
ncbi:hypothetical protein BBP40_004012 [Aspergillus hancockii]|nr:hypothetical protein BBP40_004012 [Aspergillus hancockii]